MKQKKPAKKIAAAEGKFFSITDISQDYHSQFGLIKKADLKKKTAESNKGTKFSIFDPTFADHYSRINRLAQIIPMKDVGTIITHCGIGKNSTILDAGAGSGGLSLFLANIAKKVTTYDIRDDHIALVKKNIEFLNLKNMQVKKADIYEKIPDKNADVFTLDVPEPWLALDNVKDAVKVGGFIVSYSPTIPQTQDFVNTVHDDKDLIHIKTIEMIQREWEVQGRKVRPTTPAVGHSGFLSFVRKVS